MLKKVEKGFAYSIYQKKYHPKELTSQAKQY